MQSNKLHTRAFWFAKIINTYIEFKKKKITDNDYIKVFFKNCFKTAKTTQHNQR